MTVTGGEAALPDFWPTPAALGLPHLDGSHLALPVHPLSLGDPLRDALRETGLEQDAVLSERALLAAVPTLSMRTVAPDADPRLHLKLPLATATLGLRNRRTIKPRTLIDGAAGQRLLETVLAREPRFAESILQADETVYAHAEHELLAVLCRRYPAGLDGSAVVPMAALLSRAPGGRLVIDHLADRFYGGDPLALLDACLALLFDWQTTLFGYGIALESHQQNISLVLDRVAGATRLRLLFKDNDAPRMHTARLRETLGRRRPGPRRLRRPADLRRQRPADPGPVHHHHRPSVRGLLRLRARPARAAPPSHGSWAWSATDSRRPSSGRAPHRASPAPRCAPIVLDAPELPVKAMVSAGTLLSKERSGAADINKHYTTGPNYLLSPGTCR